MLIARRYLTTSDSPGMRGADAVNLDTGEKVRIATAPINSEQALLLRQEHKFFQHLAARFDSVVPFSWLEDQVGSRELLILSAEQGMPLTHLLVAEDSVSPLDTQLLVQLALFLVRNLRSAFVAFDLAPLISAHTIQVADHNEFKFARLPIVDLQRSTLSASIRQVGALLYQCATTYIYDGARRWASRPITRVNKRIPAALDTIIHTMISGRYPEADPFAHFEAQLQDLNVGGETDDAHYAPTTTFTRTQRDSLLTRGGDALCGAIGKYSTENPGNPSLYNGLSGLIYVLARLTAAREDDDIGKWSDTLEQGASILSDHEAGPQEYPDSLYFGQPGHALALLEAGRVLGRDSLIQRGREAADSVVEMPCGAPDILWGAAGRLKFHLWMWARYGAPPHLETARKCAEWILATQSREYGVPVWELSGTRDAPYLGYGHGIAGIGDALLELFEATGEARYRHAVIAIANTLSESALFRGNGAIDWAKSISGGVVHHRWCHGAPGIAQFWIRLATLESGLDSWALARGAILSTVNQTAHQTPSLCHGLSGSINLFLDYHTATGDGAILPAITHFEGLLSDFRIDHDGTVSWMNHRLMPDDPSFMVGYGGVVLTLSNLQARSSRVDGPIPF